MASPLDLPHIILAQTWLLGALASVGAAILTCVGLMLMKKAQYDLMGATSMEKYQPPPRLKQMLSKKKWWGGLLCYLAHSHVISAALMYAPESTVLPLSASQIFLNFWLAQAFLYERYTRSDKFATLVCIVSTMVMNWSTPSWMKAASGGHLVDFPLKKALDFTVGTWSNSGFMAYLFVWLALLIICLYVISFVSVHNVARPFAIPVLNGLLGSMTHFLAKISWTLLMEGYVKTDSADIWEPLRWLSENEAALLTVGVTVAMYFCELLSVVFGLRLLSCRFFVPAVVVAVEVLTVTQLLLFFRTYEGMTYLDIVLFVVSSTCAVVGMFFVAPEQTRIPSPRDAELNSPLLKKKGQDGKKKNEFDDYARHNHRWVLDIMNEYDIVKQEPESEKDLETVNMNDSPVDYRTCGQRALRYFPLGITLLVVLLPSLLIYFGNQFAAFVFLTVFGLYQGWRLGVHIALFSYVGIKKMEHFKNADFQALYDDESTIEPWRSSTGPKWDQLVHVVILPNYKEPMPCLQEAIMTIAESKIAKKQIVLVPGMELSEGEEEARRKASELKAFFENDFLDVFPTFHPIIEGEQRGKSANTKWAFERVIDEYLPKKAIDRRNVIVTVADADSDFHKEYFAALSYYFCRAGGGETPDRYLTIWQAPILHFKNYRDQPALVKLASLVASQHELANLADPNATRVPYSTYSLSAVLAEEVGGWDGDFISEDWHMALKCFFATAGRLRITPIFLPVMNYAPAEDTTWKTIQARYTQAKRHALGFSEMIYLLAHFGRVWKAIGTPWGKSLYKWRAMFLGVKLLMIHLVMAVFFINSLLNGYLISEFAHDPRIQYLDANTWTFLINCVFQSMALIAFMSIFLISVLVYEAVKERVVDESESFEDRVNRIREGTSREVELGLRWRSQSANFVITLVQSLLLLMPFFAAASVTEWIAAWKCRKGHTFTYIVAARGPGATAKPQRDSAAAR